MYAAGRLSLDVNPALRAGLETKGLHYEQV